MSDKKSGGNYCQTKNRGKRGRGRPRVYSEPSRRVTIRLRPGTEHDEVLEVVDGLPDRARSAWVVHALLCYVRGEIRDVEREAKELSEELEMDLFSMFAEEGYGEEG